MSDTAGKLTKAQLRDVSGLARDAAQEAWLAQLVMTPDVEVFRAGIYPPSDSCGLYALFNGDGALNYIGASGQVGYRIVQHQWAAKRGERAAFVEYGYLPVSWDVLLGVEAAHIAALEPPENRTVPPPTLIFHDKLVALIRAAWGPKQYRFEITT